MKNPNSERERHSFKCVAGGQERKINTDDDDEGAFRLRLLHHYFLLPRGFIFS